MQPPSPETSIHSSEAEFSSSPAILWRSREKNGTVFWMEFSVLDRTDTCSTIRRFVLSFFVSFSVVFGKSPHSSTRGLCAANPKKK
jgi:hypothetical protein